MLEAYHKLQPKPKTVLQLNDALQQMWTALCKNSIAKGVKDFRKQLWASVPANGRYFEHKI